jgi:O-methyltransferase involved in polyketide biosynthesis
LVAPEKRVGGDAVTSVGLGEVQETLLATLYARAVETRSRRGLLRDDKAVEMVESIDYDFSKFDGCPMLLGSVLRTLILDHWVTGFLSRHPGGTVVEVGAGLNTRFDRVASERTHWIDIDLPDSMALRRRFFSESGRRRMIAASILDDGWPELVRESPGPFFFVIEGVLLYLSHGEVNQALHGIAENFLGSYVAFDTAGAELVGNQEHPALRKRVSASLTWACDDPAGLEQAVPGLRLTESRTLVQLPAAIRSRLPWSYRCLLPVVRVLYRRRAQVFRVNRYAVAERG